MRSTKQISKVNGNINSFRQYAIEKFGEDAVEAGLLRAQLQFIALTHDLKIPSQIWNKKNRVEPEEGQRGYKFLIPAELDVADGNERFESFSKAVYLTFGSQYNGTLSFKDMKTVKENYPNVKIPSSLWKCKASRGRFVLTLDYSEYEGIESKNLSQFVKVVKEKKVKEKKVKTKKVKKAKVKSVKIPEATVASKTRAKKTASVKLVKIV